MNGSGMLENIINFTLGFLPVAAGFMPATLYQLKYKMKLSILYSIAGSLLVGLLWWWGLYDLEKNQESFDIVMILMIGSYLLFRFEKKRN